MNIGNFNKNLEKGEASNFISNFLKELSNHLNKNNKANNNQEKIEAFKNRVEEIREKIKEKNKSQVLEEGKVYVINDINNNEIGVVDIEDGYEFNIYISTESEVEQNLNHNVDVRKTYRMDKEEFVNIGLGKNITMKGGKCEIYEGKIEIKNADAYDTLQNLYFNLEQEKDTKSK